jgi:hypothetical protein
MCEFLCLAVLGRVHRLHLSLIAGLPPFRRGSLAPGFLALLLHKAFAVHLLGGVLVQSRVLARWARRPCEPGPFLPFWASGSLKRAVASVSSTPSSNRT